MRIGFDGKRATQNFRGLGSYSRGLLEGLLEYSDDELYLYSSSVKDARALIWLKNHANSRLHLKIPNHSFEELLPSLWRSFTICSDLERDKLDLYHGLSHEIPFNFKRKHSFKTAVTIHDLIFMRYPEFFPFLDRVTYKRKFDYSVKNADLVIAICEQTKRDVIEFLGADEKKVVVHYQSCDPIFYETKNSIEKNNLVKKYKLLRPFILHVGAFEPNKNQLRLIEAFAKSSNQIEQDLVLVGNGKSYLEECKNRTVNLNLTDRVHFLSGIPFHELPVFYQMADLFCFPSLFEGFGIPIVEALFSKTPVITSLGFCFPESAGPDSEYVNPHSVAELSDRIRKVLSSSTQREIMADKGFAFVQKFHRKNSAEKLLECYQRIF